ncbi:MAG: 2-amino-4-hydroxy-6-hydroxymethyldihydropteridine diphosphokinase, partial [Gammaproteobacteria bacterium]|nr:2-amino-4-hydroxy-6-hydroxymethyldihydropteridine diphosphokinase [Gammaproteobacteria bacterium]
MARIYISLGSNIEPELHLRNALGCMQHHFFDLRLSPVYETEAVGFDGDPFLNLVAECETTLSPEKVQAELKSIEDKNGRLRDGPKFSARTLDLDLLLYDDLDLRGQGMDVPRDEINKYAFVLKPLCDLVPGLKHPVSKETMQTLWQKMAEDFQPMRV